MFRNKQLDRIEKKIDRLQAEFEVVLDEVYSKKSSYIKLDTKNVDKAVRGMRKIGKKAEKPKRKYVRSGKYAKVTTKKT